MNKALITDGIIRTFKAVPKAAGWLLTTINNVDTDFSSLSSANTISKVPAQETDWHVYDNGYESSGIIDPVSPHPNSQAAYIWLNNDLDQYDELIDSRT